MKLPNILHRSFSARLSFFILACATLVFALAFGVSYHFSSRSMERHAQTASENLLQIINLQIESVLRRIEAVPDNLNWVIANGKMVPDSMYSITQNVLRNNPDIYGSAIAFEPYYFKEKGYYFSPYSYREGDSIRSLQLGSRDYDYFEWEWYREPKALGQPCWSEPYYDEGGGQKVMCTYSSPIHDRDGKMIGIFTSDISLEWLSNIINGMKRNDQSYTFMLGRDGTYIVHYLQERILRQTIFGVSKEMTDPKVVVLGENMIAGKQGLQILDNDGVISYVFYAPVPHTQWSLAIVLPKEEVFGNLHKINMLIVLIVGLGWMVLFVISARIIRKLQHTTSAKEQIESELRIARDIQMGMIPKIFPPFPEREEIDLYAVLHPAKEVGGDLYDYLIENNTFHFVIGDVSGKGVPASLLMAVTRSLFRSVVLRVDAPAAVMHSLNASISENNESNMFVTLFIGALDLKTGHLRFCNAGHNPPVLINPKGECTCLDVLSNIPVGVMEGYAYQEQSLTLADSSTLVLYTDGVTEAENVHHNLYGEEPFLKILTRHSKDQPREMVDTVISNIKNFVGDNEPSDDITLLIIKYEKLRKVDVQTLLISNEMSELTKVADFVEQLGAQLGLPPAWVMKLNLALEEAVSNIILYAYKEQPQGQQIEIRASYCDNSLRLTIIDGGEAFDPRLQDDPDISLPVEERPIGGLGVFLIKQIMDKVEYQRINDKNILILSKNIINKSVNQ
jgi:Serine phosphatase RsbU, regulator of sigma subunit